MIESNQKQNTAVQDQQNTGDFEAAQRSLLTKDGDSLTISYSFNNLIPEFLDYQLYELRHSPSTAKKYEQSLKALQKALPHTTHPQDLKLPDITGFKKAMFQRKLSECTVNAILFALRAFLKFCMEAHQLQVLEPRLIKAVPIPKKKVNYLSKEEINQLLNSFGTNTIAGIRMRALMEILLASGMRISEALSLNRDSIDWEKREASIIGKGNKPRDVFFSERALSYLKVYLEQRKDNNEALFITLGKVRRWTSHDMSKAFKRYVARAGLGKRKITPHVLRHTAATLMLNNGSDIMFIKDLLGHSDIKTTAKYYLGVDKTALKAMRDKYLVFA